MDIKNCPRCGKMFTSVAGKSICHNCEKIEEEDFKKVKEFVNENDEATLDMIVKETEVSLKRVNKFIREGRLEISRGLRDAFRCESCGAQIHTGKYCEKCFTSIKTDLVEALRPPDENRRGKMHIGRRSL